MKRLFWAVCCASLVTVSGSSWAATWYVNENVSTSGTGTSWVSPVKTIQEAVGKSAGGDQIWVKEGTYPLSGTIIVDKAVSIYGGFPTAVTSPVWGDRDWCEHPTIVDGQGAVRCWYLYAGCTIDGFVITNGSAQYGSGMRVYLSYAPLIANCLFFGNDASQDGGGLYSNAYSAPVVTNCIFWENIAVRGAAVFNDTGAEAVMVNCTMYGNGDERTERAGGVFSGQASATVIVNSILWGNNALEGSQLFNEYSTANVSFCDIDQAGYAGSNGNIRQDPLWVDAVNGDFHLTRQSPCIDVGNNSAPGIPGYDFEGDPRVLDGNGDGSARVDMGADEFARYPDPNNDFDADGVPDILWRNPTSGANALWYMSNDGTTIKSAGGMPSCGTTWQVAGVADLDNDGVPDIMWRRPSTGTNALWYMQSNGSSIKSAGGMPSCGTSWHAAGVADFDGDGVPDVLWRNPATGANALWYLQADGSSIKTVGGVPSCGTTWQVAGVADFDNDGVPDIMWRRPSTGANALWYMQSNGSSIKSAGGMPSCSTVWQVGKIADFDADGVPDIVWRNQSTGVNALWYMESNGSSIKSAGGMPSCGTNWEIGG